jgi:isocitrate/isopropylmalate dehydrogenase
MPGDGIGPEVTLQATRVLEIVARLADVQLEFRQELVGGGCIDETGTALTPEGLRHAKRSAAILFGAVGGPKWDDPTAPVRPEDGLLALRKGLGLYANLRPVKVFGPLAAASPLKADIRSVDFIVVRELTGGLYFGRPKRVWDTPAGRRAVDTNAYSEAEIERVLRVGFELARGRAGHRPPVASDSHSPRATVPGRAGRARTGGHRRDAAGHGAAAVRRDRHREHVRGHPDRRGRGDRRIDGHDSRGKGSPTRLLRS